MTITTKFEMGQFVESVLEEPGSPGMIVAFMVRGLNHSYQVSWKACEEASWHLDYELRPAEDKRVIAFPVKVDGREGAGV